MNNKNIQDDWLLPSSRSKTEFISYLKKKANLGYNDRNQFFEFFNDRLSVAAQ
jgi:hypothetical protein